MHRTQRDVNEPFSGIEHLIKFAQTITIYNDFDSRVIIHKLIDLPTAELVHCLVSMHAEQNQKFTGL
jgi:hypothetical protein